MVVKVVEFHNAVYHGEKRRVKRLLLKNDISVDVPGFGGDTALFIACSRGHETLIPTLLRYGANPNRRNSLGATSVHAAVKSGNVKILSMVIIAGGDLRFHDKNGDSVQDWIKFTDEKKKSRMLDFFDKLRHFAVFFLCNEIERNDASSTAIQRLIKEQLYYWRKITGFHSVVSSAELPFLCNFGYGTTYFNLGSNCGNVGSIPILSEADIKHDEYGNTYNNGPFFVMESMEWKNIKVTVKRLHKKPPMGGYTDLLIVENSNMMQLRHPSILQLMGTCQTINVDSIVLIFERTCSSLFNYLYRQEATLTGFSVCEILKQISEALIYLHQRHYLHCSLTSHAVQFTSKDHVKLSNFEYMANSKDNCAGCDVASNRITNALYNWMAPEVISGQIPTAASDLYSLTSLLWELINGMPPWSGLEAGDIEVELLRLGNSINITENIGSPFYALLECGLAIDPEKRTISVGQFADVLAKFLMGANDNCGKSAIKDVLHIDLKDKEQMSSVFSSFPKEDKSNCSTNVKSGVSNLKTTEVGGKQLPLDISGITKFTESERSENESDSNSGSMYCKVNEMQDTQEPSAQTSYLNQNEDIIPDPIKSIIAKPMMMPKLPSQYSAYKLYSRNIKEERTIFREASNEEASNFSSHISTGIVQQQDSKGKQEASTKHSVPHFYASARKKNEIIDLLQKSGNKTSELTKHVSVQLESERQNQSTSKRTASIFPSSASNSNEDEVVSELLVKSNTKSDHQAEVQWAPQNDSDRQSQSCSKRTTPEYSVTLSNRSLSTLSSSYLGSSFNDSVVKPASHHVPEKTTLVGGRTKHFAFSKSARTITQPGCITLEPKQRYTFNKIKSESMMNTKERNDLPRLFKEPDLIENLDNSVISTKGSVTKKFDETNPQTSSPLSSGNTATISTRSLTGNMYEHKPHVFTSTQFLSPREIFFKKELTETKEYYRSETYLPVRKMNVFQFSNRTIPIQVNASPPVTKSKYGYKRSVKDLANSFQEKVTEHKQKQESLNLKGGKCSSDKLFKSKQCLQPVFPNKSKPIGDMGVSSSSSLKDKTFGHLKNNQTYTDAKQTKVVVNEGEMNIKTSRDSSPSTPVQDSIPCASSGDEDVASFVETILNNSYQEVMNKYGHSECCYGTSVDC